MSAPSAALAATSAGESDLAGIAGIFEDMAAGFNARDVDQADRHFCSDASVVTPDGRRIEGLDALRRYHAARFAGPTTGWQTGYQVLGATFVDPRTAIVSTAQDTTTPDGPFRNHGTFVVVERDGGWWIAAVHSTRVDDGTPP